MILISNNDYHDIDCMNEINIMIIELLLLINMMKKKKNDFYKYLIEYGANIYTDLKNNQINYLKSKIFN